MNYIHICVCVCTYPLIHLLVPLFLQKSYARIPLACCLRWSPHRPCFTASTWTATAASPGGTWPLSMTGHGRAKRPAKSCLEMAGDHGRFRYKTQ